MSNIDEAKQQAWLDCDKKGQIGAFDYAFDAGASWQKSQSCSICVAKDDEIKRLKEALRVIAMCNISESCLDCKDDTGETDCANVPIARKALTGVGRF